MINTTINKAAADLSKTASIFYDRAIFLSDTVPGWLRAIIAHMCVCVCVCGWVHLFPCSQRNNLAMLPVTEFYFSRLKINHAMTTNVCAFILEFAVDTNNNSDSWASLNQNLMVLIVNRLQLFKI